MLYHFGCSTSIFRSLQRPTTHTEPYQDIKTEKEFTNIQTDTNTRKLIQLNRSKFRLFRFNSRFSVWLDFGLVRFRFGWNRWFAPSNPKGMDDSACVRGPWEIIEMAVILIPLKFTRFFLQRLGVDCVFIARPSKCVPKSPQCYRLTEKSNQIVQAFVKVTRGFLRLFSRRFFLHCCCWCLIGSV